MISHKNLKTSTPLYGQLVIGPPGSGKTTYCYHVSNFLKKLDRNVGVINMDPANENMLYQPDIDIMQLISLTDVMEHHNLGPNGALMYCMEYIEENFDWLLEKLKTSLKNYFIFDCPGQVELYTHHKSMSNIFTKLQSFNYHLCTVHLIDSHYCSEPTKFISTLLLSLNTMLQMSLPHVNVLSKADILHKYENKLKFNLDFYTDVLDLKYLLDCIDNTSEMKKYKKLNSAIVSMIEDYSLVSFKPLNVYNTDSLLRLKNIIDKVNGYIFSAAEEKCINTLLACAIGVETENERMENDINPYMFNST